MGVQNYQPMTLADALGHRNENGNRIGEHPSRDARADLPYQQHRIDPLATAGVNDWTFKKTSMPKRCETPRRPGSASTTNCQRFANGVGLSLHCIATAFCRTRPHSNCPSIRHHLVRTYRPRLKHYQCSWRGGIGSLLDPPIENATLANWLLPTRAMLRVAAGRRPFREVFQEHVFRVDGRVLLTRPVCRPVSGAS